MNSPKEAIILCGGLGTRLKSVLPNLPKPMAPVKNKPFLAFILEYLKRQNIKKVILAVSYKYEIIQNYFQNSYLNMEIVYSIEDEPLGTGGAIAEALKFVDQNSVYILNGDTIFDINRKMQRNNIDNEMNPNKEERLNDNQNQENQEDGIRRKRK